MERTKIVPGKSITPKMFAKNISISNMVCSETEGQQKTLTEYLDRWNAMQASYTFEIGPMCVSLQERAAVNFTEN